MKISGNGIEITRISLPRLAWLTIALVMFWHLLFITCRPDNRERVIGSDGAGYYAYLPAIFIYHDYEYNFTKPGPEKVDFQAADYTLFMNITPEGKHINKYFIGTSLMELPFFLTAYATAPVFGYHANGYSFPFQLAVAIAAIFYVLIGLDQLIKLLRKMGVSEPIQAVTILLIFIGTNLYHYALNESSMSHAYSFSMVAIFLNQSHNVLHGKNRRAVLWTFLALTMVIFLRPVNAVVVFALPFIAGSWKNFTDGLRFTFSQKSMIFGGAFAFALVLFLQLLMYKLCTGKWINDSYSGESLNLLKVHFSNVLFSWRKGWFIYTPLMIFAVVGIFFLPSRFHRWAFFVFLMINIWVIASWQCWSYGGCVGMRPMIDTYAMMAVPLAFVLHRMFQKWKMLISIPLIGFIVVLNLVQIYQYKWGILPYDETTFSIYKKIFFKTDLSYMWLFQPPAIVERTLPPGSTPRGTISENFEPDTSGALNRFVTTDNVFAGKYAMKLDTSEVTEIMCVNVYDYIPAELNHKAWVVIKAKVFLTSDRMNARMGVSFRSNGEQYGINTPPIYGFVESYGEWQDFTYAIHIPVPPGADLEMCCFLGHDKTTMTYADDVTLEFYTEP